MQEEEERKQREEEERKAQEERDRLQAIEDARFAEETAALDVWLVHQNGCYEEWKSEEWKEKQVRMLHWMCLVKRTCHRYRQI